FLWPPQQTVRADDLSFHGIYAFNDMQQVIDSYRYLADMTTPFIFGKVMLWGTVIEHQKGYRAELAKIVSRDKCPGELWGLIDKPLRFLEALKQDYQVP